MRMRLHIILSGKKMMILKNALEPQLNAHICVHYLKEVLNFWSENGGYKMLSNCQSPKGHPL